MQCLEWFAKEFKLAIISNIDDYLIEQTLNSLGVPFAAVVTSEQARSYKPAPEIFEIALKVIAEDPGKIVHIAEGLCEAIPARQLGMGSIWVRRTKRSDDGSGGVPQLTVTSLTALVDLLKDRSLV